MDKIEEDLSTVLSLPGYTAHVRRRGQIPHHNPGAVNRHAVTMAYIRLGLMVIALAGAILLACRYLNEEKKSEKIEVTIKNESNENLKVAYSDSTQHPSIKKDSAQKKK
jgi:hypothetical protein